MVRSPHAHARIVRIDTAAALAIPGVLAVLTGADLVADGLKAMAHRPVPTNPHEVPLKSPDGSPFFVADPLPLPVDRVRFVGEPVAMVVAETALAARDGAERVVVDWEPLPAVVTSTDAIAAGAVAVWDACASNVAVETEAGDATATDAAFARAAHVVTLDSRINRVTGVPMEPRAAVGDFDTSTGRYTVYAGSGGSWRIRNDVAVVLGVPPESVRVIARDVGGSYGTRNPCYPEYPLVAWAAKRVRRPVKWTGDRRESLISDTHARDLVVHAELALDADGTFLAYRARNTSNVGAHTVSFIPLAKGIGVSTSVYHVPAASAARPRRAEQHGADVALSRRRSPGNHVRHRTAHRSRRATTRLRSDRAAAEKSSEVERDAVSQPRGSRLRQRRLRRRPGSPGRAVGLEGIRVPSRGCAPARTVPRYRLRALHRAEHRRSA
jgi:carbon-monoxide dehydrogenase large subunit